MESGLFASLRTRSCPGSIILVIIVSQVQADLAGIAVRLPDSAHPVPAFPVLLPAEGRVFPETDPLIPEALLCPEGLFAPK